MQDPEFESVLRGCRANARWAWEAVYEHFAPDVLRYLRTQDAAAADDLLGDVFVQMVSKLGSFSGGSDDFRGWLFRIAQNRLIDHRRRMSTRVQPADADAAARIDEMPGAEPDPETSAYAREGDKRIYRMLGALPHDQRAVVFMRYALDMSPTEIATALDRPVGAVKMLQQRGLRTLQQRWPSTVSEELA